MEGSLGFAYQSDFYERLPMAKGLVKLDSDLTHEKALISFSL